MFADRAAQEEQMTVASMPAPGGRKGTQLRQRFHVFYGARGEAYVCSAGDGCRILFHDVSTGLKVHTLALPARMRGKVTSVSVVGALDQVLFATDDGIIWRYDATHAEKEEEKEKEKDGGSGAGAGEGVEEKKSEGGEGDEGRGKGE